MADLNRQQTTILIELYREHSVLWDIGCTAYKDQRARRNALVSIQARLQEACNVFLDIEDIKTKIRNIRTCFSRELQRLQRTMTSGAGTSEVYEPTYAYWYKLQFLRPIVKTRQTYESTTNMDSEQLHDQDGMQTYDRSDDDESFTKITSFRHSKRQTREASPELSVLESSLLHAATRVYPPAAAKTPTHQASTAIPLTPQGAPSPLEIHPHVPSRLSCAMDDTSTTSNQHFKIKTPEREPRAPGLTLDSASMIWAQNLVIDLNKINNAKKKIVLQIQISRLVHDAILEDIENQMP